MKFYEIEPGTFFRGVDDDERTLLQKLDESSYIIIRLYNNRDINKAYPIEALEGKVMTPKFMLRNWDDYKLSDWDIVLAVSL